MLSLRKSIFISLIVILSFSCSIETIKDQGKEDKVISNSDKKFEIKILSNDSSRAITTSVYEVIGLEIAVVFKETGETINSFNWQPSTGDTSYYVSTAVSGEYDINIVHIGDNNGEILEINESVTVNFKPMQFAVVNIIPGQIGKINIVNSKVVNNIFWSKIESENSWLNPEYRLNSFIPTYESINGGVVTYPEGKFGNCISYFMDKSVLQGGSQFVTMNVTNEVKELSESGSYEFWAKVGSTTSSPIDTRLEIKIGGLNLLIQHYVGGHTTNGLHAVIYAPDNDLIRTPLGTSEVGIWKHYYFAWDKNKTLGNNQYSVRLWIDGVNVQNVESFSSTPSGYWGVFMSSAWISTDNKNIVLFDNFKLWDNVLTDNSDEILSRFNNGNGIE